MRKFMKRISLLTVLMVAVSLLISAVPAQAAGTLLISPAPTKKSVKWAFSTSNGKKKASVDGTITMEKGEYQDMNLYRNSKQIKESDVTYKVSWYSSDKNVVYIDKASGRMKADKFGKMTTDSGTAKITAVIKNKQTGTMTKKSFTVQVVSKSSALPSNFRVFDYESSNVVISAINGGVAITKKYGLYGAMNTQGKEIVPNEYDSIVHYPTDKGYFVLKKEGKIYFFDKSGTEILSEIYHTGLGLKIEGDKAFWKEELFGYTAYDLKDRIGRVYGTYSFDNNYGYGSIIRANGSVLEAKYIFDLEYYEAQCVAVHDLDGKGRSKYGSIIADYLGVIDAEEYFVVCSSYDNNVVLMFDHDNFGIIDVTSGNIAGEDADLAKAENTFTMKLVKPSEVFEKYTDYAPEESVDWQFGCYGIRDDGETRFSVNEQAVIYFDVADERVMLLLNFKDAIVDKNGYVTNLDDVVKGKVYDYIGLSKTGYHCAEDDGTLLYLDKNGNEVATYKDLTNFVGEGYALVIKESGMVYLIDTKFNEIPTGYTAEYVTVLGETLVAVEGDAYHCFVIE